MPDPHVHHDDEIDRQLVALDENSDAAVDEVGLIHRDIKPGNIWLEEGGERASGEFRVKLLDFGLARLEQDDAQLTQSGAILGTPAYMAPEQAKGEKVDARADLWSVGVILYELSTARRPFCGDNALATLTSLAIDQPLAPQWVKPDIPSALSDLVMQLLEEDPARRPASAREVISALAAVERSIQLPETIDATVAELSSVESEDSKTVMLPLAAVARRSPLRLGWAIAAALLFIGGGVLLFQVIIVRDKDGNEVARITMPKDGKFEIVGQGEKPNDQNLSSPKERGDEGEGIADRRAAEYVLSIGGNVWVNDEQTHIGAVAELSQTSFRVTIISLVGKTRVTDEGLAHLKGCKYLKHLYLSQPAVTDGGLAHLKDCSNLLLLDLSFTQVTDAGLAFFNGCKKLTSLTLHATRVTDAGLAHFKDCKNLAQLNLNRTRVTDLSLPWLSSQAGSVVQLMDTRISRLGHEQLKAVHPASKIEWSERNHHLALDLLKLGGQLEIAAPDEDRPHRTNSTDELVTGYFQVRRVSLADVKPSLGDIPNLIHQLNDPQFDRFQWLDLSRLAEPPDLAFLNGVHGLEELILAQAGLNDVKLGRLPAQPRLKRLVLDGNDLGPSSAFFLIQTQTQLEDLSLGCAGIDLPAVIHLGELKRLKRLSLAGSGVTDLSLKHLARLTSLETLDLRQTKVTAATVAELQQALPTCRIETE